MQASVLPKIDGRLFFQKTRQPLPFPDFSELGQDLGYCFEFLPRNSQEIFQVSQEFEGRNFVCILKKKSGSIVLDISKLPPAKKRKWLSKTWIPRILFVITVCFVLIDGFYRTIGVNRLAEIGDPFAVAVLYAWALIGILGVHEAGHLIAAKWHKIKTTWPYFIPCLLYTSPSPRDRG